MKKIFFVVALFLFSGAYAMADNYRELVRQLVMENVSEQTAIINSLKQYVSKGKKDAKWYNSDNFEKYSSSKLPDDIIDLTLQCYRDNMTEGQLKELVTQYKSPEIIEANKHLPPVTSQIVIEMAHAMPDIVVAVAKGNEPELPAATQCSEEYERAFDAYWGSFGTELKRAFSEMQQSDNGEKKELFAKISPYIAKALKHIALNNFVKSVTLEDLEAINKLEQSDAYRARMKVTDCINSTHPKLLDEVKARFEAWAKAQ